MMLSGFFGGSSNSTGYKAFKDKDQPKQGNTAAAKDVAGAKDKLASAAPGFSFGGKKPEPKPATQAKGTESTPLLGR